MRANDLAKLLANQAESVARLLLPNGKRKGSEWLCGDLSGNAGDSLKVHLSGDKAGVWSDFSTGDSGDLVGLWMAVKGLSVSQACAEIKTYLGVTEVNPVMAPKVYKRPDKDGITSLTDEHAAWLKDVRKISIDAMRRYRLKSRNGWLMFPYLRGDDLIGAKYRKVPSKEFRQDAGCEPALFGWQAIDPSARKVIICEGELDALAWATYGFPAVSVPMGAGTGAKHAWIDTEFERLDLMDEIFLSFDMDAAGQDSLAELVQRLGSERCRIVNLPCKDANQCLIEDVPESVIRQCLENARSQDPEELRQAIDFEDAMVAEIHRRDEGLTLPWPKTHDLLKLRRGEVSLWSGINGHGKSTLVNHVLVDCAIVQNAKICAASMEYRIPKWLHRLSLTAAGITSPSESHLRNVFRQLSKSLLLFDVAGSAKAKRILEVFSYASRRYGSELYLIDNLTKCGFAEDDYSGQKGFVEALGDFARRDNVHVAIVCHMRKGDSGEEKPSGKFGVKGSGGIVDMADTLIEVWRNKPKERAMAAHKPGDPLPVEASHADTILTVHKQRETGKEPTVNLWYSPECMQYLASPEHRPRPIVDVRAGDTPPPPYARQGMPDE